MHRASGEPTKHFQSYESDLSKNNQLRSSSNHNKWMKLAAAVDCSTPCRRPTWHHTVKINGWEAFCGKLLLLTLSLGPSPIFAHAASFVVALCFYLNFCSCAINPDFELPFSSETINITGAQVDLIGKRGNFGLGCGLFE